MVGTLTAFQFAIYGKFPPIRERGLWQYWEFWVVLGCRCARPKLSTPAQIPLPPPPITTLPVAPKAYANPNPKRRREKDPRCHRWCRARQINAILNHLGTYNDGGGVWG